MKLLFALLGTWGSFTIVGLALITLGSLAYPVKASSPNVKENANQTATVVESSHASSMIDGVPVLRYMGSSNAPIDIDGLTKRADLIVVVKVQQNLWESKPYIFRDSDGGISGYVSLTQVNVRKVIKGSQDLKGKSIPIAQEIVVDDSKPGTPIIRAVEEVEPFVKGRYIMFLEKTNNLEAFSPIGVWGKFSTDGLDKSEDRLKSSDAFKELQRKVRQQIKDDQL